MQIELNYNSHYYKNNVVYITIGFRNGIAAKYYKYKDEIKSCNLAFAHLLANYIKSSRENIAEAHIGHTTTCFSIKSTQNDMFTDLIDLIDMFISLHLEEETFLQVKKTTLENFKNAYKDGEFRAQYKALEIANISKGYTFDGLINDLLSIEFHQFTLLFQDIIKSGECFIYINGNIRDLSDQELLLLEEKTNSEEVPPVLCGKRIDPYLLDDAHIVETARESHNVVVLHIAFDKTVCMLDRYVWASIEADRIPYKEKEISVDEFDTSILVSMSELTSVKDIFRQTIEKEQFDNARGQILIKYNRWLEKLPYIFNEKYVEMKLSGCSLTDYLSTIDHLSYEGYLKASSKIRPIINEGQVVMRREVINE